MTKTSLANPYGSCSHSKCMLFESFFHALITRKQDFIKAGTRYERNGRIFISFGHLSAMHESA